MPVTTAPALSHGSASMSQISISSYEKQIFMFLIIVKHFKLTPVIVTAFDFCYSLFIGLIATT